MILPRSPSSWIFLRPPEGEVSTLLLSLLKEMGGMVLTLAALPWLALRNPVRQWAVVDALIVGLSILALTPLLSLRMTGIWQDVSAVPIVGAVCGAARSSRSARLAEAAGGALEACREFLKSGLFSGRVGRGPA
jgi:hypothetical protein